MRFPIVTSAALVLAALSSADAQQRADTTRRQPASKAAAPASKAPATKAPAQAAVTKAAPPSQTKSAPVPATKTVTPPASKAPAQAVTKAAPPAATKAAPAPAATNTATKVAAPPTQAVTKVAAPPTKVAAPPTQAVTKTAVPATKSVTTPAPAVTKAGAPQTKAAPATTPAATTQAAATKAAPAATKAAPVAPAPPPIAIVPSQANLRFAASGETSVLSARVLDQRTRRPVPRASVLWRSSSPRVVTVSPNGQVAAVNNGTAQLWAVSGRDSVAVPVVVQRRAARLGFTPERVYLDAIGTWAPLRVDVRDARNNALTDDRRTPPVCRMRDDYVASLAANGRITARNNGIAWITCQREDLRDSVRVEVRQRAARAQIVADGPSYQLRNVGDSLRLAMIAVDRMGEAITDGWVTWTSEEPGIAHVDVSTGVVIGVSVGATTIVGRIDGIEDSITIAVRDPLPPGSIAARQRERIASRLPLPTGTFGAVPTGEVGTAAPVGEPVRPTGPAVPLDRVTELDVIEPLTAPKPGDTVQVRAIARNARRDLLTGKTVLWTMRDTTIARVLPDGRMVVSDTGRAVVYGAIGNVVDSAVVMVRLASASGVTSTPATSASGARAGGPTATRRAATTGPRNQALVDSIIRTDVIGTSTMRSRFPRRSISITPLVGMGERKVDDRAVGDETTPTLSVRGLTYGGQLDVALNRIFNLQGLFLAGTLKPQGTAPGLEQTMAEMRGTLGIAVQPWFVLNGGASYRGFKRAVATDRWLTFQGGGELRMDFVGGALRGIVGGSYIPSVKIDSVSSKPDLGIGAAAGLEYRARLFTAGLRYEVERYDFPEVTNKHLEQISSLRLRLGLLLGRY